MKIFCVGRNYADHAKELSNDMPDEPVIFMKPKSALLQPHTPFYYPEFTNELHYECELVLRISKNGKYIQDKFANKYYDAVTVGIDFTARDIQNELKEKGLPWEKARTRRRNDQIEYVFFIVKYLIIVLDSPYGTYKLSGLLSQKTFTLVVVF